MQEIFALKLMKNMCFFIPHDPKHTEMFTVITGLKVKQMALCCCSVLICCKSALSSKCSAVHTQQSQLLFTLGLRPLEVHGRLLGSNNTLFSFKVLYEDWCMTV